VSLGTELAGPHLCLGTVYLGTGGYENAVKEFNRALEIEPAMEVAYVNLGMAYQRLNQKDKAEQTLNKAIDLKPQYWATHSALGLFYYNDGKYALAQQKFQQAAKLAPDSYRAHSAMGVVYDKLGRTKEAIAAFEKSMSIRQNYIAASNLGTVYLLNGLYQKAVTTYRQALRINSNDFVVWGNLGSALHWSHQDQDAAAAYEEARKRAEERLKVDRRNYTVLMRLAEYNGALGSKSESLSYLRRALQEAPDDLDVLLKAAVVYEYNLKQRDDALQMLEKLIQRSQEAPNKQVDQEAVWTQIDRSPSLSELRKDPRFDKLLKLRNTP
jgi:tetratricopeptide (TPR) repeat protein